MSLALTRWSSKTDKKVIKGGETDIDEEAMNVSMGTIDDDLSEGGIGINTKVLDRNVFKGQIPNGREVE